MDNEPVGLEPDWGAYRKRLRERWGRRRYALIGFAIGVVSLFVVAFRVLARPDYPAGDLRNEPWFVVGEAAFGLLVVGLAFYASLRALRLDRGNGQKPQS